MLRRTSFIFSSYAETSRLRLISGATPNEGRVEVDVGDGRGWGTICDNGWGYNDASVVCKQIGYPAATFSTPGARFGGNPTLPILLENVACSPSHTTIDECPSANPSASCDHTNDAGVKCMVPGFLGCFSLLTIGSRAWTIPENSNDACKAQCKDLDYRYAGMSGTSCRCGNNRLFYFYNQYPDYYCNSNCKGDATQLCGNTVSSYFSVFDTTLGICEDPGDPQNGNRTGDDFAFGATIAFTCLDEHVLTGDPILQCVLGNSPHDVRWSGNLPECVIPTSTQQGAMEMRTSTIVDVTIDPMMSSENPNAPQNSQTLSSGAIAGISVVMVMIIIAFVILAVLYVLKKKKEAKERASELHPEVLNQKSDSVENVYEINESNVTGSETDLPPSTTGGHTVDARNTAGNMSNGQPPRALPSIHLYADVTLPPEDIISPTSDYGTVYYASDEDNKESPARNPGDSVDETQHQDRDKKFYFVLESALPNDHADKGQCSTQKPQVKARAPKGRFVKKPPRNAPKNVETLHNQGTSADNIPHANPSFEGSFVPESESARVDVLPGVGAVTEQTGATLQHEPKSPESPKYVNSEFHDAPKNLIENTLYKPSDFKSTEAAESKQTLCVPNPKTRLRNNSESEATPKSPPYANSDPKRRRSTGEPKGQVVRSEQDEGQEASTPSITSPLYTNTEFHAVPDNMIDNELYKSCTPGK
eukprot:XP_011666963.1 PREDICTED: uncharacterized protein LOC100891205 isoform X2 [Strongylocentrotus purpuratus]